MLLAVHLITLSNAQQQYIHQYDISNRETRNQVVEVAQHYHIVWLYTTDGQKLRGSSVGKWLATNSSVFEDKHFTCLFVGPIGPRE